MLRLMFHLARQRRAQQSGMRGQDGSQSVPSTTDAVTSDISPSISTNISFIQELLASPSDLLIREMVVGPSRIGMSLISIDGLVDKKVLNEQVMHVLLSGDWIHQMSLPNDRNELVRVLQHQVLSINDIDHVSTMDDLMLALLSGDAILLVEGSSEALVIGCQGWAARGIEEPETEALIRGPREGFTESLRTNTALIRRRLRDPNLRFENVKIGRRAKKDVVICYIAGITHPDLLNEVRRRLNTIDLDNPEGSGMIEQWLSDSYLSPFPQIQSTERPDKTATSILEGKVAILVDGTPFVPIMPVTIGSLVQSPEDYYHNWFISTLMRILRLIAAFIATFLPALYIALGEFHQGMIPSKLAFSIAGSREGVPFPGVIEAILMEVTLEVLREAGIRLPKPIGQTIGIVGGLVIGEAAVAAGIVSPIMVIVVSITAISSFALPSYTFAITLRVLRFGIMMAAAVFGLYGVVLAYIMINIHIVNLKSFGIPFSTPIAPFFRNDWKDLLIRAPYTVMTKRPQMMQTSDKVRMKKKR